MSQRYATHTIHSEPYYQQLFAILSQAIDAGLKHKETAQRLQEARLVSPTGQPFSAKTVSNMLKSLRTPLEFPSIAYRMMMKFILDGKLSKRQCLPLLSPAGGM